MFFDGVGVREFGFVGEHAAGAAPAGAERQRSSLRRMFGRNLPTGFIKSPYGWQTAANDCGVRLCGSPHCGAGIFPQWVCRIRATELGEET